MDKPSHILIAGAYATTVVSVLKGLHATSICLPEWRVL